MPSTLACLLRAMSSRALPLRALRLGADHASRTALRAVNGRRFAPSTDAASRRPQTPLRAICRVCRVCRGRVRIFAAGVRDFALGLRGFGVGVRNSEAGVRVFIPGLRGIRAGARSFGAGADVCHQNCEPQSPGADETLGFAIWRRSLKPRPVWVWGSCFCTKNTKPSPT